MGNDPIPDGLKDTLGGNAEEPSSSLPFKIVAEPLVSSRGPALIESIPEVPVALPAVTPISTSTAYDNLGELPANYQTGAVYLAARDPHWLFVYWDLDLESFDRKLMVEDEATFYLKVFTVAGELTDQIRVNTQAKNWYFPIKDAGVSYYVELGFNDINYKWAIVGTSNTTLAPTDGFTEGPAEFASVPFHLSFHRLLELVQGEMNAGNSLIGSLSRLQSDAVNNLGELSSDWTSEQRKILETLVGKEEVSRIGMGSAEVDFQKRLEETLSSFGSSEISLLKNLTGGLLEGGSLSSDIGAKWFAESSWSGSPGSSWSA